jgi:hypothetical protein
MLPNNLVTPSPFNTFSFIPNAGAPASDFYGPLDAARTDGGWKVFIVHGFTGGDDYAFKPIDFQTFVDAVGYAKGQSDLWLDTYLNVGAYWRAEDVFNHVQPTISGNDRTWSWGLPDHFPPGKCLRVSVDGGTLIQNGTVLPWNSHGYYEVSLDAGSLTLSP